MSNTQIATRQIQNGAINDAQVNAAAAIASSKLADGANWVKKDGSVAFTGQPDFGNQVGKNAGTPTNGTDVANKSYVDNQITALQNIFQAKGGVRAIPTASVTISNPGTSTFDGVVCSSGDRLLLVNQSTASQNGIYVFNGSGVAMTRSTDMATWAEVLAAVVPVESEGATNNNTVWLATVAPGGTLGTTSITFIKINSSGGLAASNFVKRETPSGTLNGSNTTFTLANTPTAGTEEVYLNGMQLDAGAGNDYTISGATITMLTAPLSTDKLRASYMK